MTDIQSFVEIVRPESVPSRVLLFSVGFFLVNYQINTDYFIGLMVIILALAYAAVQNDIEDIAIDRINTPTKALAGNKISLREATIFSDLLLICLLVFSLYNFPHHLFFGLIILFFIWAYNKSPLLFSHRPVASIVVLALMYAVFPLSYGYYLGQSFTMNYYLIVLLISVFLVRVSITILKDFKDALGDRNHGKNTFILVYGTRITAIVSLTAACLGYTGVIFTVFLLSKSWLIPILLIPIALWTILIRLHLFRTNNRQTLTKIFYQTFFKQNLFNLTVLLCLVLLR